MSAAVFREGIVCLLSSVGKVASAGDIRERSARA
jgi:hypothetical protein